MATDMIATFLAYLLAMTLVFYVPTVVNQFNDNMFGNITILDVQGVVPALKTVQVEGVLMCAHGWRHEDWTQLEAAEAKQLTEQILDVFGKAGLVPAAFISPYRDYSVLPPSIRATIESFGIDGDLPVLNTNGTRVGDYGWNWRTITSPDDPRINISL